MKTKNIVVGAMIGAIYVVLTLLFAPISFGPGQVRISEALTLLPLIFPSSVWGLFIGCIISNFFGGYGVIDIVFGSLATLVSAYATYVIGKKMKNPNVAAILGGIPPVIINAIVIGLVLMYATKNTVDAMVFYGFALEIFISQALSIYIIGLPLLYFMKKLNLNKHQV